MQIDILTLFPDMFVTPFNESILKRAQDHKIITIKTYNYRDWAIDIHRTVDDHPFGGGAGMVLKVDIVDRALKGIGAIKNTPNQKIVVTSAQGTAFTQKTAQSYATLERLVILCGHYEGFDQRVIEHLVDDEVRIGSYVLTGGELPAMVMTDAITRLLPGVLGNELSALDESHTTPLIGEYPQYTRPASYLGMDVPEVLLSGHHALIEQWRIQNKKPIQD